MCNTLSSVISFVCNGDGNGASLLVEPTVNCRPSTIWQCLPFSDHSRSAILSNKLPSNPPRYNEIENVWNSRRSAFSGLPRNPICCIFSSKKSPNFILTYWTQEEEGYSNQFQERIRDPKKYLKNYLFFMNHAFWKTRDYHINNSLTFGSCFLPII